MSKRKLSSAKAHSDDEEYEDVNDGDYESRGRGGRGKKGGPKQGKKTKSMGKAIAIAESEDLDPDMDHSSQFFDCSHLALKPDHK